MIDSGEAMELDLFPEDPYGGSIPTSPLQFKVVPISKKQASEIYRLHHYLGEKGFLHQFSFGALYNGVLWGAITFSIPNPHSIKGLYNKDDQSGVLEINRLAFASDSPKNSCSRMISIATRLLRKRYPLKLLISYADTAQKHTGAIYKASGFISHGLTAKKKDFASPDGKIVGKLKGAIYSNMEGSWISRSQKYLYSRSFT